MLYQLFKWLDQTYDLPGAGLWQFTSFRAGMGLVISLIISMLFGGRIINFLRSLQIGETVRDLGLEGQLSKKGTPTMGGVIIIMGIVVPVLLVADLNNIYVLIMLLVTTWMAIIGFIDDYIKVFRKNKDGLSSRSKLIGQVVCGLIVAVMMIQSDEISVRLETETADDLGYEQVSLPYDVKDAKGDTIEVAHYKAYITNVPFTRFRSTIRAPSRPRSCASSRTSPRC